MSLVLKGSRKQLDITDKHTTRKSFSTDSTASSAQMLPASQQGADPLPNTEVARIDDDDPIANFPTKWRVWNDDTVRESLHNKVQQAHPRRWCQQEHPLPIIV